MIHLVLLSAPRGAGKTTACCRLVCQAREMDLRLGGILTLARCDEGGARIGLDAVDILTQERRPLAVVTADPQQATVGSYRFDTQNLAWALERALLALAAPIDAVVVDEIGPLELIQGAGFAPVLDHLAEAQAAAAILVVRAELLTRLQTRLAAFRPTTVTLTLANRDQIPARLLEEIWEGGI